VGVRYALLAYCSWGLFPLFWKLLKDIPSFELLCHRLFWSFAFYTLLRFIKERKYSPKLGLKKREILYLFIASTLLSGNWLLYIYAVNTGRVVESSLGYFINPLVNILLGVVFLKEALKKHHKIAVAIVSIGVLIITLEAHSLPWIALTLAFSFSLYGFVRKKTFP
jgi:chloramphenicol-sensitive protein RarD